MNYKKEYEKIQAFEPKDYFKPTAGKHEILILTEPKDADFTEGDKVTEQIELEVQVKDKVLSWTISKGQSFKSLYGQLMALGNAKGKLREETISLLVSGVEKNKSYVVLEALPYTKNNASSNI